MYEIKNEFILDGKVQKEVNILSDIASFNISSITGTMKRPDNTSRYKYTFIRVLYTGEDIELLKEKLFPGAFIRLYGKLDSEQYIDKNGKTVYNKILLANHISLLKNNEEVKVV